MGFLDLFRSKDSKRLALLEEEISILQRKIKWLETEQEEEIDKIKNYAHRMEMKYRMRETREQRNQEDAAVQEELARILPNLQGGDLKEIMSAVMSSPILSAKLLKEAPKLLKDMG